MLLFFFSSSEFIFLFRCWINGLSWSLLVLPLILDWSILCNATHKKLCLLLTHVNLQYKKIELQLEVRRRYPEYSSTSAASVADMNLVVQCWCSAYGAHQTIESRRAILQFACKYILLSRILRTLPREIDETSLPFRLSYPVSSVLFIRRLCLILFKDIPIKRPWKFPL